MRVVLINKRIEFVKTHGFEEKLKQSQHRRGGQTDRGLWQDAQQNLGTFVLQRNIGQTQ
jgi:hypothetical protein